MAVNLFVLLSHYQLSKSAFKSMNSKAGFGYVAHHTSQPFIFETTGMQQVQIWYRWTEGHNLT